MYNGLVILASAFALGFGPRPTSRVAPVSDLLWGTGQEFYLLQEFGQTWDWLNTSWSVLKEINDSHALRREGVDAIPASWSDEAIQRLYKDTYEALQRRVTCVKNAKEKLVDENNKVRRILFLRQSTMKWPFRRCTTDCNDWTKSRTN